RPPRSPLFPYTTLFRSMRTRRLAAAVAGGIASVMVLSACGASADPGGSDGSTDGVTIDVLAVNLPAQEDLVKLTEEHFTKKTGRSEEHTSELQSRENLV